MLNKVEGGNYHGFNNDHHHHPVNHSVRRRRRLLLDETTVRLTKTGVTHAYDRHPNMDHSCRGCGHRSDCTCGMVQLQKKETISETPVSYTHLRAHETRHDLVCR